MKYDLIYIAKAFDRNANVDEALDMIFGDFDIMMREGRIDELDSMLDSIRVTDFSIDILIGFLTASLPVRQSSKARQSLFDRVSKYFDELCLDDKEELLQGLGYG